MSEDAITNLQRRVAALEARRDSRAFDEHALKSQAAATQGNSNLYAPLRSDTKPLIEMAAFVREIAMFNPDATLDLAFSVLIRKAQEILKRST